MSKWYEVHCFGNALFVGEVKAEDNEKITFEKLYTIMVIPDQQGNTSIVPIRVQPIFKYSKDVSNPTIFKSQIYSYYEMSETDVKKLKDLIIEIEAMQSGLEIPGKTPGIGGGQSGGNLKLLKN